MITIKIKYKKKVIMFYAVDTSHKSTCTIFCQSSLKTRINWDLMCLIFECLLLYFVKDEVYYFIFRSYK